MQHYANKAWPLTKLLKNGSLFHWSPAAQTAFDLMKQAMTSTPVLALQILIKPLKWPLGIGIDGGVLAQNKHPIAFFSRKLSPTMQKITIHLCQRIVCCCSSCLSFEAILAWQQVHHLYRSN